MLHVWVHQTIIGRYLKKKHKYISLCVFDYENLKHDVLKCNANVYFKKHCLNLNLVPKYANIKISNTCTDRNLHNRKIIE
jgi:hypothetical protein